MTVEELDLYLLLKLESASHTFRSRESHYLRVSMTAASEDAKLNLF